MASRNLHSSGGKVLRVLLVLAFVAPTAALRIAPQVRADNVAPPPVSIAHVDVSSAPFYSTDGLTFNVTRTISQLDITITVQTADGTLPASDQSNFQMSNGPLNHNIVDTGSTITYYFNMDGVGPYFPEAGHYPSVVAQFNPNGGAHPFAGDTYQVTGISVGQAFSYSGTFDTTDAPQAIPAISSHPYLNSANTGYSEEDVAVAISRAVTALTVTLTVATAGHNLLYLGQYNSLPTSTQVMTSANGQFITYVWTYQATLSMGKVAFIVPGVYTLAAQFSPRGIVHSYGGDSYVLTGVSAGQAYSQSATFITGDPPTATPTLTPTMTPSPTSTKTATPLSTPTVKATATVLTSATSTAMPTTTRISAASVFHPHPTATPVLEMHRVFTLIHGKKVALFACSLTIKDKYGKNTKKSVPCPRLKKLTATQHQLKPKPGKVARSKRVALLF